ncbi:hypothetical protein EDD85DRAFT_735561, partial [Armillaria nabsnona]
YGLDSDQKSVGGFKTKQPHCIGFVDSNNLDAFRFLNPDVMIRVVHLESVFTRSHTSYFLPLSITQHSDEQDKDWKCFYINIYA